MRKMFYRIVVIFSIFCCLSTSVGAVGMEIEEVHVETGAVETATNMRASGSFNVSVKPYTRGKGDTDFPLEAGETVRIYATYSPESAKMDFGLVDPVGVFHYVSASNGSVDTTIEVPASGNYRLGIKNNSGQTVKVSGFVKY